MNLAEILAKKKAAAELASGQPSTASSASVIQPTAPVPSAEMTKTTPTADSGNVSVAQTSAAVSATKTESVSENKLSTATTSSSTGNTGQSSAQPSASTPAVPEKPLTFAEKMALKKLGTQGSQTSTVDSAIATTKSVVPMVSPMDSGSLPNSSEQQTANPLVALATDPQKSSPVKALSNVMQSAATALLQADISMEHVAEDTTPEVKEGYALIATKIRGLTAASEDNDLKNAMTSLKQAIKENPASSGLLLPEEIGAIVIALRKIVGESITVAEKAPKEAKAKAKKTDKALTAEELEKGWEDL